MTNEETAIGADFDHFAIVELMGHVRMAGRLTEVERFGSKLGKIEVIDRAGDVVATQYFGGASVYRITPCTEETAREMAKSASSAGPDVPWNVHRAIEKECEARMKQIEARAEDDEDEADDDDYPSRF